MANMCTVCGKDNCSADLEEYETEYGYEEDENHDHAMNKRDDRQQEVDDLLDQLNSAVCLQEQYQASNNELLLQVSELSLKLATTERIVVEERASKTGCQQRLERAMAILERRVPIFQAALTKERAKLANEKSVNERLGKEIDTAVAKMRHMEATKFQLEDSLQLWEGRARRGRARVNELEGQLQKLNTMPVFTQEHLRQRDEERKDMKEFTDAAAKREVELQATVGRQKAGLKRLECEVERLKSSPMDHNLEAQKVEYERRLGRAKDTIERLSLHLKEAQLDVWKANGSRTVRETRPPGEVSVKDEDMS